MAKENSKVAGFGDLDVSINRAENFYIAGEDFNSRYRSVDVVCLPELGFVCACGSEKKRKKNVR